MKNRKMYAVLSATVALMLAVMACGGGPAAPATSAPATKVSSNKPTPTEKAAVEPTATKKAAKPTATPKPENGNNGNEVPAGEIGVTTLNTYVDNYGYYHVAGEILNNTDDPLTSIELTLTVVDSDGKTVLKDSSDAELDEQTFSPHLYTLAPGELSTYDYYIYTDNAKTDDWKAAVEVTESDKGQVDRGKVEIQNQRLMQDDSGNYYISGEVVNTEDKPVVINSLSGAILDADNQVLGADYSFSYARYLAPAGDEAGNDRTPYIVSVDGPIDSSEQSTVYLDVDFSDGTDVIAVKLQDTEKNNLYWDQYGRLHVVTAVTNDSDTFVAVTLVAGLYAENGEVLDSASYFVPVYIGPGETIPVSFDYFSNVSYNEDAAADLDHYTVQIDGHAYSTYETSFDVETLDPAEALADTDGSGKDGSWEFTGNFVNSSKSDLSSAYVLVIIYDADDNIKASSWTGVYPEGESFAPGDKKEFTIYLELDPEVDAATDYTFAFYVQGYPK